MSKLRARWPAGREPSFRAQNSAVPGVQLSDARHASTERRPTTALSAFDNAIALDPAYAEALYDRAGLDLRLRREDDALHDLDRCLVAVPQAALCVQLRMEVRAGRGECDVAEKDAREWLRLRPEVDAPLRALADVLAAEGRPLEAVEELLRRAGATKAMSVSDALPRAPWDPVLVNVLKGDLGEAAREAEDLARQVDGDTRDSFHAEVAEARVRLYAEMGDASSSALVAKAYLDRRDAFSTDLRPIDSYGHSSFQDITQLTLATLRRKGVLTPTEAVRRRDARAAVLRAAWASDWAMWSWYASGVETEAEAREALAAFEKVPLSPGAIDDESDSGRALLLGGRVDEAIPRLEKSVRSCRGLTTALAKTRSAYFLGLAREAKGDQDGACDAYGAVVARWGHARPRSVTAERAAARRTALHCAR